MLAMNLFSSSTLLSLIFLENTLVLGCTPLTWSENSKGYGGVMLELSGSLSFHIVRRLYHVFSCFDSVTCKALYQTGHGVSGISLSWKSAGASGNFSHMLRESLLWTAKHKWLEILIECSGGAARHRLSLDDSEIPMVFEEFSPVLWPEAQILRIGRLQRWITSRVCHKLGVTAKLLNLP